ncbi:MAG: hypothetical protein GX851_08510 [Clostridiales bacterium]|nr:hypothetical protein [Clostridiales bacterium]
MTPLKFYVITDTHFFRNSIGAHGAEYDRFMHFEQKCFAETEAINKAVFEYLEKTRDADIVLIAGDLSFNGEKESHLAFIELLKQLRSSGKSVYVITAGHDFNEHPFAFDETGRLEPEGTRREELFDLYYEFGFSDAIAVDREHLSYVAQLGDGVRLLALINDGDCQQQRTYDAAQLAWIKEQAAAARRDGQLLIAMNHYPLLPGQPLFSIVPDAVQKNSGEITDMLADEGVHLVFTGHMHNQSINEKVTPSGNRFYDVCTGAVIACPAYMRLVSVLDKNTVDIKSIPIPSFKWDTNGRTCEKYLSDLFDSMIINILTDMRDDPERVLSKFHAGDKKKLFPLVRFLGRRFNSITVGGFCRMLCVRCDKSIKKLLLKDYIVEMVRGVFVGNQTFNEGTPKGDALLGVFGRLNPILKKIKVKDVNGEPADLFELVKTSVGNYGLDDYNARLRLSDE